MGEHRIFVDNLRITYEGPFNARDLFRTIRTFTYEMGYDGKPLKETQIDTPMGKQIEWHSGAWKKITDHMRFEMCTRIIINDLTKKEVLVNGRKVITDYGKVFVVINGYMESDYNVFWEDRPMFIFMRTLYDKYVFKEYMQRWEHIMQQHANSLYVLIQQHFNLFNTHGMRTEPNSIALHD